MVASPSQAVADFATHNFAVADCLVLPALNRIMRAGEPVPVEPKVMQVLVCLASRGQEVVSKQELLDVVWPGTFVSDHVLTHVVWQLRKALGSAELIETVPRRGYRLTVEAVLQSQPGPNLAATAPPRHGRRALLASLIVLAVLAGAGAVWVKQYRLATARSPIRRLMLLPFDCTGAGEDQRLLVAGIDSSLREQFLEVHGLKLLTARTTAWMYAGSTRKSPAELAQQARADAVVYGTAAVIDGRVRIGLEVWDAHSSRVFVSETFERDWKDILGLYGEVVRKVAQAGNVAIADAEALRLGGPVRNPEAVREYTLGLGLGASPRNWEQALQHYRRTIALDPQFAPAYIAAAGVLRAMAANEDYSLPDRARHADEARAMARRGVQLDPHSPHALAVLAAIEARLFWNWQEAGRLYHDAENLRPDHPSVLRNYWAHLVDTRQCDQAMELVRRMEETDVSSSWPLYYAHWGHYMCGQFEAAINEAQAALARDPSARWAHHHTAYAYAGIGRYPEALAECAKSGNNGHCDEPYLLAVAGQPQQARLVLARMAKENFSPFFMALGYTGLGDRNTALEWLAKGYATRDSNMTFIWDPAFTPLRDDPRFRDLTCKLDLPPGTCAQARNQASRRSRG